MVKDKKINVRVDSELLKSLSERLGVDESKTIRACMNCTNNVLHNIFGGEVRNIFKRKKSDEELNLYDQHI